MSTKIHTINTYGIIIPSDSKMFNHVLEKLKEKHPDYFNDGQDEFEHLYYINDIEPNLTHEHHVSQFEIEKINGDFVSKVGINANFLVLHGDHKKPTLITSPFKSNEECIEYYKHQFQYILPEDFDYENNIGKIYIKIWNLT